MGDPPSVRPTRPHRRSKNIERAPASVRDYDMIRSQTKQLPFVHFNVSRFDRSGESRGIKQPRGETIFSQLMSDGRQPFRVRRKFDRLRLIVFRSRGHKFGQTNRIQQARGNSAGKCLAGKGQNRQARP